MTHPLAPLDVRINNAIVQVCEDLTVSIEEIANDICDEFDDIDLDAIVKELTEAREIQIQENRHSDRLYVEAP